MNRYLQSRYFDGEGTMRNSPMLNAWPQTRIVLTTENSTSGDDRSSKGLYYIVASGRVSCLLHSVERKSAVKPLLRLTEVMYRLDDPRS